MRKYRNLLAVLLAGALAFTSVPAEFVYAEPSDNILAEASDDEQDIVTSVPDTDDIVVVSKDEDYESVVDTLSMVSDNSIDEDIIIDTEPYVFAEEDDESRETADDALEISDRTGYIEPEWLSVPVAVEEDLSIEEINDMVEGDDTTVTDDELRVSVRVDNSRRLDKATIEPISGYTDELPSAFPAAYGTGSASELARIDDLLAARITPGRNQNPYGSCWAHEAIALTEAYQINKQSATTSIDNSERHLVYNTYNAGTNPMGFETYDSVDLVNTNEKVFEDQGGNAASAAWTLSKWRGVANETSAPYRQIGRDSWENDEFLSNAGRLENCYIINIQDNPNLVKRFIKEYGAVGISYYTPSGLRPDVSNDYYNSATNAYYNDTIDGTNHGVVIVGWDDNFPKTAFAHTPDNNGAWLVRNSWKEGGSVSEKYYGSYFWLSYQDKGILSSNNKRAFVYKMRPSDSRSDNNYFYDTQNHNNGVIPSGSQVYDIESANVFRVSGTTEYEKLDSVSIQSFASVQEQNKRNSTNYKVEVYTNLENGNPPASNDTPEMVKEGELPFSGLYTVDFEVPLLLEHDTYFAVVVTLNGGEKSADIEYGEEINDTVEIDGEDVQFSETYTPAAGPGQSFYRFKNTNAGTYTSWTDVSQDRQTGGEGFGNFCIGAQTSECGMRRNVAVYSRTDNNADSIADVSLIYENQEGEVFEGDTITAIAPDKSDEGYSFEGWHKVTAITDGKVTSYGEDILSPNLEYTFEVSDSIYLVAIYKAIGTAYVTIRGGSDDVRFNIDDDNILNYNVGRNFPLGRKLRLTAVEPDRVLKWENERGKILGKGASIVVTVCRDTTITLYYKETATENRAFLQFVSDYGQVVSGAYVTSTDTSYTIPVGPSKVGYAFRNWIFDGTGEAVSTSSIRTKIQAATNGIVTAVPDYEQETATYNITAYYRDSSDQPIQYQSQTQHVYADKPIGSTLELTAPEIDNYTFECWKNSNGDVIGYKSPYYLLVKGDMGLTACYKQVGQDVRKAEPVISLGDPYPSNVNGIHKVCVTATRCIPEGYELKEQGMLWARGITGLNVNNFKTNNLDLNQSIGTKTSSNGYLCMNIKVDDDEQIVYFRGYMIVKERSTGKTETVYSNIRSSSYSAFN